MSNDLFQELLSLLIFLDHRAQIHKIYQQNRRRADSIPKKYALLFIAVQIQLDSPAPLEKLPDLRRARESFFRLVKAHELLPHIHS
ncbi:hypothetical protein [Gimesia maris]|uniref:Uncharacterized protein n=1 Tax=Gimesia maris TaxID=122 RepID=A0ABX5YU07_9PLAN|nr:hypothetical protein [Gimesia maris]EDL57441.1 hypothetical protein PM8797T_14499 [Gimesia maris DSM 8797]QDU17198.1 hypothetical protein CA11_50380 [Gimesia maris]QEG19254.1 hypothetical protein GmarT_51520 [Gimesia maris]QGQ27871.1 hypothetical protein F1729_03945 [Gimesia maris]|tara:strand:+ start:3124 stop:3381 length:258 start_codon:yes stop_codon:yes gene_type:complete